MTLKYYFNRLMPRIIRSINPSLGRATLSTLVCANIIFGSFQIEASETRVNIELLANIDLPPRPQFSLKITNITNSPVRVLDVRERPDLQFTFYRIEIAPIDRQNNITFGVRNFGAINQDDFIELAPGETVIFVLAPLPIDYSTLVPGKYRARAICGIDPARRPIEVFVTKEITFAIPAK